MSYFSLSFFSRVFVCLFVLGLFLHCQDTPEFWAQSSSPGPATLVVGSLGMYHHTTWCFLKMCCDPIVTPRKKYWPILSHWKSLYVSSQASVIPTSRPWQPQGFSFISEVPPTWNTEYCLESCWLAQGMGIDIVLAFVLAFSFSLIYQGMMQQLSVDLCFIYIFI